MVEPKANLDPLGPKVHCAKTRLKTQVLRMWGVLAVLSGFPGPQWGPGGPKSSSGTFLLLCSRCGRCGDAVPTDSPRPFSMWWSLLRGSRALWSSARTTRSCYSKQVPRESGRAGGGGDQCGMGGAAWREVPSGNQYTEGGQGQIPGSA